MTQICERINRLKYVERLSVNLWLKSFTVAAFEGVFDAFFKVCQVQSMFFAMEVYLIPLS